VVSAGAPTPALFGFQSPGDYATFNSNHTPDGTDQRDAKHYRDWPHGFSLASTSNRFQWYVLVGLFDGCHGDPFKRWSRR
jgi:hypothetical protein